MAFTTNNEFGLDRWMSKNIFIRGLSILAMVVLLVLLAILIVPLWIAKEIIDFYDKRRGIQNGHSESCL